MKALCKVCTKEFYAAPSRQKIGQAKFCSSKCYGESNRKSYEYHKLRNTRRTQEWRKRHPGYWKREDIRLKHAVSSKKLYERVRSEALAKYGSKCVKCNVSDPRVLCFDHVKGGGITELRRYHGITYYRRVMVDSTGKYQILCHNCNWIKRHENKEHRQRGSKSV